MIWLFIALFFLTTALAQLEPTPTFFENRLCDIGDIQVGAVFRLHNTDSRVDEDGVTHLKCDYRFQDSVVLVEAMLFAIEKINQDPNILNGVKLGYNIQGTCDDSIENMFYALDAYTDLESKKENPHPLTSVNKCDSGPPIAGLIGPSSSDGTASVASLFRLSDIPVISYEATSPELGNHKRFPSFFRTIYADDKQAEALVSLVNHFDWNYITVIGSDNSIGRRGIYEFKQTMWARSNVSHLCIAHEAYFGDDEKLESILSNIRYSNSTGEERNTATNVTLLFMGWSHAVRFLTKAAEYNLQNITWIGVEQWTSNISMTFPVPGFLPGNYTDGVISTEISTETPTKFLSWLTYYLEKRIMRNPWLRQYSCDQCSRLLKLNNDQTLDNATDCPLNITLTETCLNILDIGWVVRKQRRITNVIMAVYTLAFALDELYRQNETVFKADGGYEIPYRGLVAAIQKIRRKIPILCDDQPILSFDDDGNLRDAKYEIHNFYAKDKSTASDTPASDAGDGNGIGEWIENKPTPSRRLKLNDSFLPIHWKFDEEPKSHCSRHCLPGEYIVYSPLQCCWACNRCDEGFYSTDGQSINCTVCPVHHHTNAEQDRCLPNKQISVSYKDPLAIANSVFCILGQIAVLISAVVSIVYRNTKQFSDRCTMKCAVLLDCSLGFTYVMYHAFSPEVLLCSIRRVGWQTSTTAHCVAAFFQIHWGRMQAMRLRRLRVPEGLCPYVCYAFFTLMAFGIYVVLAVEFPPVKDLTDLGPITGQWNTTYIDCGESPRGVYCIIFSVVYPGIFGLTAVLTAFREVRLHKRSSLLATLKTQPRLHVVRTDYRTVRSLLYSSYICLLVIGALAPIYFTLEDPWTKSFLLLVGICIGNTAILAIYLVPRLWSVIKERRYKGISRHDSRLADIFVTTANLTAKMGATGNRSRSAPSFSKDTDIKIRVQ